MTELLFERGQLIGGQRSDPIARRAAAVSFAQDRSQFFH